MNYASCKKCGNLFLKTGTRNICNECVRKEEDEFLKVKEYLYDYPNSSLEEVAEQTEVDKEAIINWIREGRLETKGVTISYPCDICGKTIHVGKICAKCQKEIGGVTKGLEDTIAGNANKKDQLTVFGKK